MISRVEGKVVGTKNDGKETSIELKTVTGITYKINSTVSTIEQVENQNYLQNAEPLELFTSFHVREDQQQLFGFVTEEERDFFELLQTASGVGVRTAISALNKFQVDDLKDIIVRGDLTRLGEIPGLGKKGCQKVVLELQDKIGELPSRDLAGGTSTSNVGVLAELREALQTLGFQGDELNKMVTFGKSLLSENAELKIEALIEEVLKKR